VNNQPLLGFINLDKPLNLTSHDCVAKVRRWTKMKRVGHGGTLDPAATGVLPLALGKATRLLQFFANTKVYKATLRLGCRTASDDLEEEIIEKTPASHLTLEVIQAYLPQFLGKISQIPPMYSAIQKDGKRIYDLARQGKTVELPSREVEIDQIKILDWQPGEFPELTLHIACKSGTYIRSIARDLGNALDVGGTLAGLRRTESSGFTLEKSLSLSTLETQLQTGTFTPLSADEPLQHLEPIDLSSEQAKRWCQGQFLVLPEECEQASFVRVYGENGNFLGIGEKLPPQVLKPKTVIAS
jgi:tRNA pseudouridine55 synthase